MSADPTGLRVAGGLDPVALERRLTTLGIQHFPTRLWAHDDTLWGDDPVHRVSARTESCGGTGDARRCSARWQ